MKPKLNNKQKAFVDELFKNGFNQTEAYVTVYQSVTNRDYAANAGARLMGKEWVKKYYDHKYEQYRKGLDIDKQKMIDMLKDELNLFDEMKRLANKDSLTEIEQSRFNRLSSLLKASDANKTRDMINKLIGSYSAEKVDITSMGERISINLNLGNESENRDKSDTDQ